MAANSSSLKLSKFSESKEEKIMKEALELIRHKMFINLTLRSCNGTVGSTFSKASLELAPIANIRQAYSMDCLPNSKFKSNKLSMLNILNEELINDFITKGVEAFENSPDLSEVFLCALEFLRDKEVHEKALQKIIDSGNGERSVTVALGQHIFAQLIPNKDYVVDQQSRQIPEVCTCGCKAKILKGNTALGSSFTWHGRVDILLNQTIAVTIMNDREEIDEAGDTCEDSATEPPVKRKRREAGKPGVKSEYEVCDDSEIASQRTRTLVDEDFLPQILSECITNGFAQVNMNNSLSGALVPTFGCTAESICVCLYDPVNDILLQNIQLMDLWARSFDKLNILTIVIIWLFLNFNTFGVQNLIEKIDLDKSGFHDKMNQSLQCYREVRTRMHITSPHTPYWYQAMEFCETVYPKH
ncbi:uncharacterized protein [Argopecten irradians]|uniref:uncharacterized protein n=1 Tax=Argopecten irradians TaxID=31199 RepID=UPI0037157E4D